MFLTPIKAALLWTLSAAIRDSFSFSYVPEDDGGALRRAARSSGALDGREFFFSRCRRGDLMSALKKVFAFYALLVYFSCKKIFFFKALIPH